MDIGTGIAIAGVWIFAGACAMSKTVTGIGMMLGTMAAVVITLYLK